MIAPTNPPNHSVCCNDTVLENPTRSCVTQSTDRLLGNKKGSCTNCHCGARCSREWTGRDNTRNHWFLSLWSFEWTVCKSGGTSTQEESNHGATGLRPRGLPLCQAEMVRSVVVFVISIRHGLLTREGGGPYFMPPALTPRGSTSHLLQPAVLGSLLYAPVPTYVW